MRPRVVGRDDGFTLAEVLAAIALIAIALLSLMVALPHGLSGIETGRGETVAVFLVEDKLEELRSIALVDWGGNALELGTTTEYCTSAGGACSTMPMTMAFRRTTTVTAAAAAPCFGRCKVITVAVFYRPLTPLGQIDLERRVDAGVMFFPRT